MYGGGGGGAGGDGGDILPEQQTEGCIGTEVITYIVFTAYRYSVIEGSLALVDC